MNNLQISDDYQPVLAHVKSFIQGNYLGTKTLG